MGRATIYRGGLVARAGGGEPEACDLLVEGGVVRAAGPGLADVDGAEVYDCEGCILLPGLFDVHVHAREPGREDKETIRSCSEAAINGGVTGIVLMPNTDPAIDSGGLVRSVLEEGAKNARIPVFTSGCVTKGRKGVELAGIAGMKAAGVVFLTDDGDPVANPQVLRRAMEYAKDFGLFVASHCEVAELTCGGAMNEGPTSYALGLPGIPTISEEICLERDIRIAQHTGCHVHIQHVTTARGMEAIRRAKEDGVSVSCEIAPHHLIFCDEDIKDYDTHLKMNPPLRSPENRGLLLEGLKAGIFDVIATDHAPHTRFEKAQDFESAPFGITGLETALVSLYDRFVRHGLLGWDVIVERFSDVPRLLIGLDAVRLEEGAAVDLVVFDMRGETCFDEGFMRSKSANTPFLGQTLRGRVRRVVLGEQILKDEGFHGDIDAVYPPRRDPDLA